MGRGFKYLNVTAPKVKRMIINNTLNIPAFDLFLPLFLETKGYSRSVSLEVSIKFSLWTVTFALLKLSVKVVYITLYC